MSIRWFKMENLTRLVEAADSLPSDMRVDLQRVLMQVQNLYDQALEGNIFGMWLFNNVAAESTTVEAYLPTTSYATMVSTHTQS